MIEEWLTEEIKVKGDFCDTQWGFKKSHSTVDTISKVMTMVEEAPTTLQP